jgi:hypothetical protein
MSYVSLSYPLSYSFFSLCNRYIIVHTSWPESGGGANYNEGVMSVVFFQNVLFSFAKSKIAKTTFIIFAALGICLPEKPKQSISSNPSLDILFLNVYVIGCNINIYDGELLDIGQ